MSPPRSTAGDTPLWFRVLDRFGFPTLVGVALLFALLRILQMDREDRLAERSAMYHAMEAHAEGLRATSAAVQKLSTQIDERLNEMRNSLAYKREERHK